MARIVYIIEQDCQGCGLCEDICPEVFRLDEESEVARVIKPKEGLEDLIQEAIESCPAECICWEEE
ncbi:MAG TPA: ferredoxin [Deltaproteobacteria bacterium]|nr:ferredoxin [Deltaproteobacteria bacterium]